MKHDKDDKRLKVLFVSEDYPPVSYGGGEISCELLAVGLAKRKDIDVTVLTSGSTDLKEMEKRKGVTVLRRLKTGGGRSSLTNNIKRKMLFKKSVKKELKNIAERYDIVHFFNITSIAYTKKPSFATINSYINFCPKGNLFYREESVCEGCGPMKFIGCLTHSDYVGGYRLKGFLKFNPAFWLALYRDYQKRKKDLKKVDHFFSLSEFINRMLVGNGISRERITKVVNMPDISISHRKVDIASRGVTIVYIGSLDKIKGVDMLIRAFNRLDVDATLAIVGDGPERERLQKMAGHKIKFLGRIPHETVHSVYRQADVVVVPSLWPEPLSRVLLEAAYFDKPIIATKVGGSPEVVKDGYNGMLVEPEEKELKIALERMISDEELRNSMCSNMKEFYRKNLSEENIVQSILDAYYDRLI